MSQELDQAALQYHQYPSAGKISVVPTKPLTSQRELSLAYSPGVAAACNAIVDTPESANTYTSRSNLVGVITNGTAVLGLGNIGALASKPVMEGKACLFKQFAGIDVFDLEFDTTDSDAFINAVAMLEPTFGGINLEDIKAPECFYIEKKLRERMGIPVFHDDQHGTAIVAAAAIQNGLKIANKKLSEVRLVTSGAGAAAIACLNLLVNLGLKKENITLVDSRGVVFKGRDASMEENKARYANETPARTLAEALKEADVFLGCSAAGLLKPEMLKTMNKSPLILALANPVPEILPEVAKEVRPDCIIATGRSDYPNQVNNVLCFPFLFRGALDCGATKITEGMKMASVNAIADLANQPVPENVKKAYPDRELSFGTDYIIPTPFDPRLIVAVATAVAKAAAEEGIAKKPIQDFDAYKAKLETLVSFKVGK